MRLTEVEFAELLSKNPKLKIKDSESVFNAQVKPVKKKAKMLIPTDESIQFIELKLPYPISVNRIYLTTPDGKRVLTKEAKEYKRTVASACLLQGVRFGMTGELTFICKVFRPRKEGDTDNFLKITQDSLEGICYQNDSQIAKIIIERFEDKLNPRTEVRFEKYEIKNE